MSLHRSVWPFVVIFIVGTLAPDARAQVPSNRVPSTPFARAHIDHKGPVTLGTAVDLAVDLVVPTWLLQPPQLPDLDVDGAVVTPAPGGVNSNEQVGSDRWSVVTYTYHVVPQKAGTIHVPPVELTFRYAIDAKPSPPTTVRTGATSFETHVPAGAEDLDYFFAAPRLTLTDRYQPRPVHLKVGEAFTRTIEMEADNARGLALPPVVVSAPAGLRISEEPPALTDAPGDRGSVPRTTRRQRITYIAQHEGSYTLPAVEVRYWNTTASGVRAVSLKAVSFDVAPAPAFTQEIALPPDHAVKAAAPESASPLMTWLRHSWRVLAAAILAIVGIAWLAKRYVPRARRALEESRQRYRESEDRYFDDVKRAARNGDLRAVHAAAMDWVARFPPCEGRATLASFVALSGSQQLADATTAIEAELFGRMSHAQATNRRLAGRFYRELGVARDAWIHEGEPISLRSGRALVPLNPE